MVPLEVRCRNDLRSLGCERSNFFVQSSLCWLVCGRLDKKESFASATNIEVLATLGRCSI